MRATWAPPPWQKHSTALLPGLTPPPPVLEAHDQPQFGKFLTRTLTLTLALTLTRTLTLTLTLTLT